MEKGDEHGCRIRGLRKYHISFCREVANLSKDACDARCILFKMHRSLWEKTAAIPPLMEPAIGMIDMFSLSFLSVWK